MAGATLNTLNEILKEFYMGPPRIEAEPIVWWSCRKHRTPQSDRYKDVCRFEELTGEPCEDKYECPHVVSVKVKDGCPECKRAEYVQVLDGHTGEPAYEARIRSTMEWELSRPSILVDGMLKGRYGTSTVKIPKEGDE